MRQKWLELKREIGQLGRAHIMCRSPGLLHLFKKQQLQHPQPQPLFLWETAGSQRGILPGCLIPSWRHLERLILPVLPTASQPYPRPSDFTAFHSQTPSSAAPPPCPVPGDSQPHQAAVRSCLSSESAVSLTPCTCCFGMALPGHVGTSSVLRQPAKME